jgi:hypothetical protein
MPFYKALANVFVDGVFRNQGEKFEYNGKPMVCLKLADNPYNPDDVTQYYDNKLEKHYRDNIEEPRNDSVNEQEEVNAEIEDIAEEQILRKCKKARAVARKKK